MSEFSPRMYPYSKVPLTMEQWERLQALLSGVATEMQSAARQSGWNVERRGEYPCVNLTYRRGFTTWTLSAAISVEKLAGDDPAVEVSISAVRSIPLVSTRRLWYQRLAVLDYAMLLDPAVIHSTIGHAITSMTERIHHS